MNRVITIANQKGGVGKTSVATNLPVFLTAFGKKVLLIDMDPQANATFSLGISPKNLSFSIYNALLHRVPFQKLIKKTPFLGYDIIPSSPSLAGAVLKLADVKNREYRLKRITDKLRKNYDFIIIDSPPSLDLLTLNALVAADELMIPVQCEYLALEGLDSLLSTVDLIRQNLDKHLKITGALLTMYDRRNKVSKTVAKEVRRNFPGYVFNAVIPRSVSLAEAPLYGKTILRYAPNSKATQAFRELAQELINRI